MDVTLRKAGATPSGIKLSETLLHPTLVILEGGLCDLKNRPQWLDSWEFFYSRQRG